EAGVPDAGGEGICAILRGLRAGLGGAPPPAVVAVPPSVASGASHAFDASGFCTEFLVERLGTAISIERLRELALAGGNASVVVVGDETLARMHAHSEEPQRLLDAA